MKVVYLADAPYIHTKRWIEHSIAQGIECEVISFRPAEIEGAKVHYVDGGEALGKARYLLHAQRVKRLVHSLQPDMVHALHLTSYGFLAALAGFHPLVISVWGTDVLEAPNLTRMLADPAVEKLFHFARFDVAMLSHHLGAETAPVYCTKIASKLVRTYTDRHGLKDICRELLGVELSKQQQSSDWGAAELSQEQLAYAASDVLYLHDLRAKLDVMLAREGRDGLAKACFDFLPTRAALDIAGWQEQDIFAH